MRHKKLFRPENEATLTLCVAVYIYYIYVCVCDVHKESQGGEPRSLTNFIRYLSFVPLLMFLTSYFDHCLCIPFPITLVYVWVSDYSTCCYDDSACVLRKRLRRLGRDVYFTSNYTKTKMKPFLTIFPYISCSKLSVLGKLISHCAESESGGRWRSLCRHVCIKCCLLSPWIPSSPANHCRHRAEIIQ